MTEAINKTIKPEEASDWVLDPAEAIKRKLRTY